MLVLLIPHGNWCNHSHDIYREIMFIKENAMMEIKLDVGASTK